MICLKNSHLLPLKATKYWIWNYCYYYDDNKDKMKVKLTFLNQFHQNETEFVLDSDVDNTTVDLWAFLVQISTLSDKTIWQDYIWLSYYLWYTSYSCWLFFGSIKQKMVIFWESKKVSFPCSFYRSDRFIRVRKYIYIYIYSTKSFLHKFFGIFTLYPRFAFLSTDWTKTFGILYKISF